LVGLFSVRLQNILKSTDLRTSARSSSTPGWLPCPADADVLYGPYLWLRIEPRSVLFFTEAHGTCRCIANWTRQGSRHGRRPRGTGERSASKFEVGDGPCIRPPNILSSVVGCARKYEESPKMVSSRNYFLKQRFSREERVMYDIW